MVFPDGSVWAAYFDMACTCAHSDKNTLRGKILKDYEHQPKCHRSRERTLVESLESRYTIVIKSNEPSWKTE